MSPALGGLSSGTLRASKSLLDTGLANLENTVPDDVFRFIVLEVCRNLEPSGPYGTVIALTNMQHGDCSAQQVAQAARIHVHPYTSAIAETTCRLEQMHQTIQGVSTHQKILRV